MRFRQAIVLGMVMAYGSGCAGWHSLEQPTPVREGNRVRVTLRNGEKIEIAGVKMTADSISGYRPVRSGRMAGRAPVAVAASDVVKVEDRRVGVGGAIIGGLLGLGAVALTGLLVVASSVNAF
jgi:hypothetical protein